jgi:hypothetical protein
VTEAHGFGNRPEIIAFRLEKKELPAGPGTRTWPRAHLWNWGSLLASPRGRVLAVCCDAQSRGTFEAGAAWRSGIRPGPADASGLGRWGPGGSPGSESTVPRRPGQGPARVAFAGKLPLFALLVRVLLPGSRLLALRGPPLQL